MSARDVTLRGQVLTLAGDDGLDTEQAVRLRDGAIDAVGSTEALGNGTPTLDFGSRTVMPGFIDPHAHVEIAARARATMVDCRVPTCRSVADVLDALRDGLANGMADVNGGWLVGQGNLFFDRKLSDGRLPTRDELDAVSADTPIVVRAGGHRTILNSAAFERAGIDRFEDGASGLMGKAVIETDDHGCPTGVVAEIDNALPIPEMGRADLRDAIERHTHALFTAYGVTSIGEITESRQGLACHDELAASGMLNARLFVLLWTPGTFTMDEACNWRETMDITAPEQRLRIQGVKMFADGGYSARNAATRQPYLEQFALEPGSRGRVNLPRDEITEALLRTREAGLQLAVHANGERAQDEVCHGVIAAGPGANGDLPTRVEHAGNLLTDITALDLWEQAGIVPIPQPVFLYNFGDFLAVYLGEHGAHGRFPFRLLLDRGWKISGSSDVHVGADEEQTNPLFSVWCTMKRQSFLGDILEGEQAVTLPESLRMHTRWAADALGVGHDRGTLEAGKLGDVIVLDRDIATVGVDELRDVKVDRVYLGGELVHERPGAAEPEVIA
jgi:predicted amidohydrolase YtcJ